MPSVKKQADPEEAPSSNRLLNAVIATWAERGHAAISARGLSQATGLPTSSIYHHFGSLDQLLLEAQARALEEAERWCARQLDLIANAPADAPDAFPALFAALVDDWALERRELGLAWRECHLLAARDPRYGPAIEGWRALWPRFWEEICARSGLPGMGVACSHLFDGESLLHMMQWRRPVDRACLDEFARGWGRWLGGSLAPEGPWRRFARQEALGARPLVPEPEGIAARIAAAAADVMEEGGVASLTHRAVAQRAGLTLGTIAYHYRTSADLVRSTFEMLYSRITRRPSRGSIDPSQRASDLQDARPLLYAMEELVVAVARDPAYAPFIPQLRYLRGRSSGPILQSMLGTDREVSPLDAALYSSFLAGQGRALSGRTEEEANIVMADSAGRLIERLGTG
ncbi:MAG: TetR family transcriptional regulator [Sphingobium sp.]